MTTTRDETAASFDIVIVGGGPAGCAAGTFCARADLDTAILRNEKSTLTRCAYVENYLGFPAGIEPRELLELMRTHARESGCAIHTETVESVQQDGEKFTVETGERSFDCETLIVASWSTSEYLDDLGVETDTAESKSVPEVQTDDDGRTTVEGVYAAGRITGTHHQALVNAGDGARVALTVINERIPDFYNDWVAPEGYYEQYDREVPLGVEEISHDERRRRAEAGRRSILEQFDADL